MFTVFAVECIAASHIDLFNDEAFYWQCGQRPDIAFVDHPPLTALLIRLETDLLGDSTLAVRLLFLLMGAVFPIVIQRLARPLVGEIEAWIAALLSVMLPGLAYLGLVAIPDVPMLLCTALFLFGFERATSTGPMRYWWLVGLSGATGLLAHYRFVLAPVAAGLYLVCTRTGRAHLKETGLWLATALTSLGALPSIAYNLRTNFEPLRYHLATRHALEFHPEGILEFVETQAALSTPLLFIAMLSALAMLIKKARAGDDRAALMSSFALTPLLVYFLASPLEVSGLAQGHWPVPAYIPLILYVPGILRRFVARRPTWWRRALATLTPGIAGAVVLVLLVELATGWFQMGRIQSPFLGWSQVAHKIGTELLPEFSKDGRRIIVVADNYKLAANLEFQLHDRIDLYVLDHRLNHKHGRSPQLVTWHMDEASLRDRGGEDALVVVQVKELRPSRRPGWMAHISSLFEELQPLGELRVEAGSHEVQFAFFRGTSIKASP